MEQITTAEAIGRMIRLTRDAQGITQEDLALDLDIAPSTLVRIEAGKLAQPIHTLLKAMDQLGIRLYLESPSELSEGKSNVRSRARKSALGNSGLLLAMISGRPKPSSAQLKAMQNADSMSAKAAEAKKPRAAKKEAPPPVATRPAKDRR
ncbi:hypothetical protein GCM10027296_21270 [Chitinimonas naiadis]